MKKQQGGRYILFFVVLLLLRGFVGWVIDPWSIQEVQCIAGGACEETDRTVLNKYTSWVQLPERLSRASSLQQNNDSVSFSSKGGKDSLDRSNNGSEGDLPVVSIVGDDTPGDTIDTGTTPPGDADVVDEDTLPGAPVDAKPDLPEQEPVGNDSVDEDTDAPVITGPHRCTHPFGGYPLSHGDTLIAWATEEVVYPDVCVKEERLCQYGSLGGTYMFTSCVQTGQSCSGPDGTVFTHGSKGTYYQYNHITGLPENGEDVCPREVRICLDGVRHNSEAGPQLFHFTYRVCEVVAPEIQ